jgi:hypothetical protein
MRRLKSNSVSNTNNFTKTSKIKTQHLFQNSSGRGLPSKKDLNSTSDLSGCENGASCDAPLTVANDSMLP